MSKSSRKGQVAVFLPPVYEDYGWQGGSRSGTLLRGRALCTEYAVGFRENIPVPGPWCATRSSSRCRVTAWHPWCTGKFYDELRCEQGKTYAPHIANVEIGYVCLEIATQVIKGLQEAAS